MDKYLKDAEFLAKIEPYIKRPEFQRLKNSQHHNDSVYSHTLRVAYKAWRVGKHFSQHPDELLRAALFHDLYFHDWREKEFIICHGWVHPVIALKNARELFGPITEREANAISSHMWPFNFTNPPRFREALIVTFSDRSVATGEVVVMFFNWIKRLVTGQKRDLKKED
ncbi:MAG: hypothetical protein A2087_13900 [Spirochaetes bacterium GWD1_61_31]|nr:MAG: hypothetical protein A2Y37_04885 [Spirochaetes bacterium GWB1_60_80]OHD29121.1 MAG: hypothetical protein A2004_10635 [Spirochaetes bacterium GWC1_61_12]OHD41877.1 MAG: hypothetical protein A2087_13900 [Spirochaetes bacterium GWD1_61_31]OHD43713.1 MAG: hypothetical protein A2Y35_00080 [Spirochaetes bacterium GWE1_60_18]OHD60195.1 MAG: hypothetical protein A2Y32_07125 [Spirochaetes bacterium GWF1_60_12]HAP42543.1 HAD family hydrolase [Spirochaetaceae bacterium]